MASLDSMREAEKSSGPNKDVEIAVRMTIKMLQEGGGMEVIAKALQTSKDPAQVVGQFLAQIVGQLAEKLNQEYGVDPRIFLAQDGWLPKILDYIEGEMGLPPEFSDEVFSQVLETIKAAAMGGKQQPAQPVPPVQPQQPGAPVMEQGGMA